MAENINKKHKCKGWTANVNNCIRAGLKLGDFTFSARVTTVPTVVRSRQAIARRGQILSYFHHELVSTSSIKMTSYNERWCTFLKWIGTVENDSHIFNWEFIFKQLLLLKSGKTMRHDGKTQAQMLALRKLINHPEPQALLIWGQKCLLCRFIWGSLEFVPITS